MVKKTILSLMMLPMLSACAFAVPVLDAADQAVIFTRKKVESIAGIHPQSQFNEEDRIPFAVYCYQTLAQVDCFSRPQENQENRLVGVGTMNSHYAGTVPYELTALRVGDRAPAAPAVYAPQELESFTPLPHGKPVADIQQAQDEEKDIVKFDINGKRFSNKDIPDYQELEDMTLQDLDQYY